MRLLHRPPETPSLSTWFSRDVPQERELAGELLQKMGREKSLKALLHLHDVEETKREKRHAVIKRVAIGFLCVYVLFFILGAPWFHLLHPAYFMLANFAFMFAGLILQFINFRWGYPTASARQSNIITALFEYDDSPLIADALCRALFYYDSGNRGGGRECEGWNLYKHLLRVLPLLPGDKNALTKDARVCLRNRLAPLENAYTPNITPELASSRAFYADFQIAVTAYLSRTKGRDALPVLRKLAKAKTFSSDGERVQNAAREALTAF